MTNRREILQMGVLASALPIAGSQFISAVNATSQGATAYTTPYKVIFDERFAQSVAFGAEARRRGARVHAIQGDITSLWYHELDAQWKAQPVAIAGLTTHGPAFCLEILARDHGMRVVYRAEHACVRNEVSHACTGPQSALDRLRALGSAGDHWPLQVASLITQFPAEHGSMASSTMVGVTHPQATADEEPLLSWVIAPKSGARRIIPSTAA